MKTLLAAACVCVIAATGYFFIQEYRTSVATAKAAEEVRDCQLTATYGHQFPELYRKYRARCGL